MAMDSCSLAQGRHACTVFNKIQKVATATSRYTANLPPPCEWKSSLPDPSKRRKVNSLNEGPYDLGEKTLLQNGGPKDSETILYLAYGSNLCAETFQGRRGIRPLSRTNVVVPELVMTFDLAGLPYIEPCFANTRYRTTDSELPVLYPEVPDADNFQLLPTTKTGYRKTQWHKGLVGVVYEVTTSDFAHIIATEGGGASYQDVLVECYELNPTEDVVPEHPASEPFKAHTLYSPVVLPGTKPPKKGGRFSRPDPNYAQPSERYLKLINDGADEHELPMEYKGYLRRLRPYTITNQRQRLGAWIFSMIWLPFVSLVFGLNAKFADENGRVPPWLAAIIGAIFKGMWVSYDEFFHKVFGDGERTVDEIVL